MCLRNTKHCRLTTERKISSAIFNMCASHYSNSSTILGLRKFKSFLKDDNYLGILQQILFKKSPGCLHDTFWLQFNKSQSSALWNCGDFYKSSKSFNHNVSEVESEKGYYKTTKLLDYSMQYFQYYTIILIRDLTWNHSNGFSWNVSENPYFALETFPHKISAFMLEVYP